MYQSMLDPNLYPTQLEFVSNPDSVLISSLIQRQIQI